MKRKTHLTPQAAYSSTPCGLYAADHILVNSLESVTCGRCLRRIAVDRKNAAKLDANALHISWILRQPGMLRVAARLGTLHNQTNYGGEYRKF